MEQDFTDGSVLRYLVRQISSRRSVGVALINEQVHIVISRLICLLKLVVQQLRVIYAEAAVLSSHTYYLVYHVKASFGYLRSGVLLADNLSNLPVASVLDLEE